MLFLKYRSQFDRAFSLLTTCFKATKIAKRVQTFKNTIKKEKIMKYSICFCIRLILTNDWCFQFISYFKFCSMPQSYMLWLCGKLPQFIKVVNE